MKITEASKLIENKPKQYDIHEKDKKTIKIGDLKIENKKSLKASMTDLNNNKIISKSTVKCINRVQKEIEQTQENKETQEVIEEKLRLFRGRIRKAGRKSRPGI